MNCNNLEVVLVHLGSRLPNYLTSNILNIQSQFPNTSIRILYGDSKQTLPKCKGEFDLIHVDGGHDAPEVISDYNESMRLIQSECPIVFDDYDYAFIKSFLDEKIRIDEIRPFVDRFTQTTTQHLMFINPSKDTHQSS